MQTKTESLIDHVRGQEEECGFEPMDLKGWTYREIHDYYDWLSEPLSWCEP